MRDEAGGGALEAGSGSMDVILRVVGRHGKIPQPPG